MTHPVTSRIEDILINNYAQDTLGLEELLKWVDSLPNEEKHQMLCFSRSCLEQAITDKQNGDVETVLKGISKIPLKPTMTPIVLLKAKSLKIALNEILKLPDSEMRKSFISLVTIFKELDTKRRNTECKNGCGHYWHNLETQRHY